MLTVPGQQTNPNNQNIDIPKEKIYFLITYNENKRHRNYINHALTEDVTLWLIEKRKTKPRDQVTILNQWKISEEKHAILKPYF